MTQQVIGVVPVFTVCDRLRKARELTGLDQEPFALELGVSRGTVSTYERDTSAAFKPVVMRAWAMRTGVKLEWLLNGETPTGPQPDGGLDVERARRDSNSQPSDPKVLPLPVAA